MTKRSSSREKRSARTSGGIFRIAPMMGRQAQPRGAGLTAVWQYRGPSKVAYLVTRVLPSACSSGVAGTAQ